jgi:tetratricopeptide (TPR) repeat protein
MIAGFPCPQCGLEVTTTAACQCGLDPTTLWAVRAAAHGHRSRALRFAGLGRWREAGIEAEASLTLQRQDNDLAAFLVLVVSLAEPTFRSVNSVPEPRAPALPEPLRRFLGPVVRTVRGLKALSREGNTALENDLASIRRVLREGVMSPWIAESTQAAEDDAPLARDRAITSGWSRYLSSGAIGLILGMALVVVVGPPFSSDTSRTDNATAGTPQTAPLPAPSLSVRSDKPGRDGSMDRLLAFQELVIARDWRGLAEFLGPLDESRRSELLQKLPSSIGRELYLEGLGASRRHEFDQARRLLESAIEVSPTDAYFLDDAIYFRARAEHRIGAQMDAIALYQELIASFPESPYVSDSARFLTELKNREDASGAE